MSVIKEIQKRKGNKERTKEKRTLDKINNTRYLIKKMQMQEQREDRQDRIEPAWSKRKKKDKGKLANPKG